MIAVLAPIGTLTDHREAPEGDGRCEVATAIYKTHRLNYDHVGSELPADLAVLCDYCHAALSGKRPRVQAEGGNASIRSASPRAGAIQALHERERVTPIHRGFQLHAKRV
jgi:hypothetical protein